jgi:hypothetical protein
VNVHAPSEEKSSDSKDSFYEQVFGHFPEYRMEILLGDFNTKMGIEDIFNRQLGLRVYIRIVLIVVLE